ncbi:hypothetical protein [Massilia sp. Leaf139]|nr:hypothetical protein [Massilia sp. Leaf139]
MAAIETLLFPKRQRERGGEWFIMQAYLLIHLLIFVVFQRSRGGTS